MKSAHVLFVLLFRSSIETGSFLHSPLACNPTGGLPNLLINIDTIRNLAEDVQAMLKIILHRLHPGSHVAS